MPRTSAQLVQKLLADNFGPLADATLPRLEQFVSMGSMFVDRVAQCAARKGFQHTPSELEMLERIMAAHYYTKQDPTYSSRAGASFVRDPENPEPFKGMAVEFDASGCVRVLLKRQVVMFSDLGKPSVGQSDVGVNG